jgi:hypothetical protein
MDADDASPAEMRRRPADPHDDPLALDGETAERLLTGRLSPAQAPPGYAEVAALLAAAAAPPAPEELTGEAAALAELRAVTRARVAGSRRATRPARRRRVGLVAIVAAGALATGGVAAAATGHLPGPVQDAARSILVTVGSGEPAPPATPAPRPSTPGSGGTGQGPASTAATSRGPGTTGAAAAANPNLDGLCRAYQAGEGAEQGGKLDAAAYEALARAAGGRERIPAYCHDLLPPDKKAKEHRQPAPPAPGQGQGGPPTSGGGDNNGQGADGP